MGATSSLQAALLLSVRPNVVIQVEHASDTERRERSSLIGKCNLPKAKTDSGRRRTLAEAQDERDSGVLANRLTTPLQGISRE